MIKPLYQLYPDLGICVNDFNSFFFSRIRSVIFDQIEKYNLYKDMLKKLDPSFKRLIKHHVIHLVCERIRKAYTRGNLRNIIYTHREAFERSCQLPSVYMERAVWHALVDIESKLPIRVYFAKYSYEDFTNPLISSGVVKEVKRELIQLAEKDYDTFTFEKIKKFTEKEGLVYLNKEYFQGLKSKLIMSV